jgi:hypothetical protein
MESEISINPISQNSFEYLKVVFRFLIEVLNPAASLKKLDTCQSPDHYCLNCGFFELYPKFKPLDSIVCTKFYAELLKILKARGFEVFSQDYEENKEKDEYLETEEPGNPVETQYSEMKEEEKFPETESYTENKQSSLENKEILDVIDAILNEFHRLSNENNCSDQKTIFDASLKTLCPVHKYIYINLIEEIECRCEKFYIYAGNNYQYFGVSDLFRQINSDKIAKIQSIPEFLLKNYSNETNFAALDNKLEEIIQDKIQNIVSKCPKISCGDRRVHKYIVSRSRNYYTLVFTWEKVEITHTNCFILSISIPFKINLKNIYAYPKDCFYSIKGFIMKSYEGYLFANLNVENDKWDIGDTDNEGNAMLLDWSELLETIIKKRCFIIGALYKKRIEINGNIRNYDYIRLEKMAYECDAFIKNYGFAEYWGKLSTNK